MFPPAYIYLACRADWCFPHQPKDLAELFLRPGAITKRWLGLALGAPLGDGTRAGVGGALGGFHEGWVACFFAPKRFVHPFG